MKEVYININSIEKVNKLVTILNQHEGNFDIVEGSYIIDAKSVMGIMTMDLSRPKKLVAMNDESLALQDISEFIVNENM